MLCRFFLGGGNSNIFGIFTPKIGDDSHFDSYFFSDGLVQPRTSLALALSCIHVYGPMVINHGECYNATKTPVSSATSETIKRGMLFCFKYSQMQFAKRGLLEIPYFECRPLPPWRHFSFHPMFFCRTCLRWRFIGGSFKALRTNGNQWDWKTWTDPEAPIEQWKKGPWLFKGYI